MVHYEQQIQRYFELRATPDSSRESYFRRMKAFMKFMEHSNKPIEHMVFEDIQDYILYLKQQRGLSAGTINNYISAIKLFYTLVLEGEWNAKQIPRMKRRSTMPVIPPRKDVLALLDQTTNLKHKAMLTLLYGSGLRVSEVARLKISDICSHTMRVRVDHAKHNTNWYTILSHAGLLVLRQYFKAYFSSDYTPDDWLFQGREKGSAIHVEPF